LNNFFIWYKIRQELLLRGQCDKKENCGYFADDGLSVGDKMRVSGRQYRQYENW
jgi:hypothetical protein